MSCFSGAGGNYLFENARIYDSLMGARFKGVLGTTCNVTNVTWRNIELQNVSYPIHFTETYIDQEKPSSGPVAPLAAYAKDFSWENVSGSVASILGDGSCISTPCWYASLGKSRLIAYLSHTFLVKYHLVTKSFRRKSPERTLSTL